MDKSYRFLSDTEPTDEQLAGLMQFVTQDVKDYAAQIAQKHKAFMQEQLKASLQEWQSIQLKNGKK